MAIWFCGLQSVALHVQRVADRVSQGGHDIPQDKIRARYDSARENLIELLPYLAELHVYDNSVAADAHGRATPLPLLQLDREGLHHPVTVIDLLKTPDWAKPIVMRAMELHASA